MIVSPKTTKARRVLDKLPSNLLSTEHQEELLGFIENNFKHNEYGKQYPGGVLSTFEIDHLGFELPATVQLERLSNKLAKWHQTQEHIQTMKHSSPTNFKHFLEQKEKKLNQVIKRREAYIKDNFVKKVKEKHEQWETKCNAQRKENRIYERNQNEQSLVD